MVQVLPPRKSFPRSPFPSFSRGFLLVAERAVVGRALDGVEHADRDRELREGHAREELGEGGVRLVVDQDVVEGPPAFADGHDLERERLRVQDETLVIVRAEEQRLAFEVWPKGLLWATVYSSVILVAILTGTAVPRKNCASVVDMSGSSLLPAAKQWFNWQ